MIVATYQIAAISRALRWFRNGNRKKTMGVFLTKEKMESGKDWQLIYGRGKFHWGDARAKRALCFSFYDWSLGLKCFHDGCVLCFFIVSPCHLVICARLAELGCSLKASRLGMIVAELNGWVRGKQDYPCFLRFSLFYLYHFYSTLSPFFILISCFLCHVLWLNWPVWNGLPLLVSKQFFPLLWKKMILSGERDECMQCR